MKKNRMIFGVIVINVLLVLFIGPLSVNAQKIQTQDSGISAYRNQDCFPRKSYGETVSAMLTMELVNDASLKVVNRQLIKDAPKELGKALTDKIYLKDGSIIVGKIINISEEEIKVETKIGIISIKKELILNIVFEEKILKAKKEFDLLEKWQSLGFDLGYNIPSESNFKKFYGNSFKVGASYSMFLDKSIEITLSLKYTRKKSKEFDHASFRNIPVSLIFKFLIPFQEKYIFYLGIGGNYNFSKVKSQVATLREFAPPILLGEEFKQKEEGLGINLNVGMRLIILSSLSFDGELEYTYTFLGNPEKGRFGNIGGLNFNSSFKYHF